MESKCRGSFARSPCSTLRQSAFDSGTKPLQDTVIQRTGYYSTAETP